MHSRLLYTRPGRLGLSLDVHRLFDVRTAGKDLTDPLGGHVHRVGGLVGVAPHDSREPHVHDVALRRAGEVTLDRHRLSHACGDGLAELQHHVGDRGRRAVAGLTIELEERDARHEIDTSKLVLDDEGRHHAVAVGPPRRCVGGHLERERAELDILVVMRRRDDTDELFAGRRHRGLRAEGAEGEEGLGLVVVHGLAVEAGDRVLVARVAPNSDDVCDTRSCHVATHPITEPACRMVRDVGEDAHEGGLSGRHDGIDVLDAHRRAGHEGPPVVELAIADEHLDIHRLVHTYGVRRVELDGQVGDGGLFPGRDDFILQDEFVFVSRDHHRSGDLRGRGEEHVAERLGLVRVGVERIGIVRVPGRPGVEVIRVAVVRIGLDGTGVRIGDEPRVEGGVEDDDVGVRVAVGLVAAPLIGVDCGVVHVTRNEVVRSHPLARASGEENAHDDCTDVHGVLQDKSVKRCESPVRKANRGQ